MPPTIAWKDGTPATGVYVSLLDIGQSAASRARGAGGAMSGADGRFVIDAREGRVYRFVTTNNTVLVSHGQHG